MQPLDIAFGLDYEKAGKRKIAFEKYTTSHTVLGPIAYKRDLFNTRQFAKRGINGVFLETNTKFVFIRMRARSNGQCW